MRRRPGTYALTGERKPLTPFVPAKAGTQVGLAEGSVIPGEASVPPSSFGEAKPRPEDRFPQTPAALHLPNPILRFRGR